MIDNKIENNWFESWFDSPFYHKLYYQRDFSEAELFIRNLHKFLKLKENLKVLDLACGKGRHALNLSQLGLSVTGLDIAPNSIDEAKKLENQNLSFDVHDMREVYKSSKFDVIFNLFTSFGYFDDDSDNIRVLNAVNSMLTEKGILVIDFLNARKVIKTLVKKEQKTIDDTCFYLERSYTGSHIIKTINFEDKEQVFNFTERVQAIHYEDFIAMFQQTGFKLIKSFGDYHLNEFNPENSNRLILIAQKI
jgi:SAM-dependent methyltransferase